MCVTLVKLHFIIPVPFLNTSLSSPCVFTLFTFVYNNHILHFLKLHIGSYGINVSMGFDVERISLLKRGWCLAFCHVR